MSSQPSTPQNVKTWVPLTEEERDELRRIKENWVPPSKDERYRIARLAKQVRGLYRDEQKAVHFVAEAQTMERGVCSQSLKKHAADYGYTLRQLQWGFHGRRREGKIVIPGLLARGIVFVTGGYPNGGLAPGGQGLTPDYAINLKWMLRYIPEVDDSDFSKSPEPSGPVETPQKDEPKDEPRGEPFAKKDEPRDDLMRTSSLNSSLSPELNVIPDPTPSGASKEGREGQSSQDVVVVGGETPSHRAINSYSGAPGVSSASSPSSAGKAPASPVSSSKESPVAPGAAGGQGNTNPVGSGRKNQDETQSENRIIAEFEDIFDRVKSQAGTLWSKRTLQREIELQADAVFNTTKPQCKKVAEFYRAVGGEKTLAMWEEFLVTVNHAVNTSDDSPQRTYYLTDFLVWADRQLVKENRIRELQEEAALE